MADPAEPEVGDDSLVAAARGGDVRALDALLRRNERTVLRVLTLLGVPRQDREDVAQEVFLRVFRHLDTYRPGRPFSGWLYRVTVNAAHDYRIRTLRVRRGEVPWSPEADDAPDLDPRADDAAGRKHLLRRLEGALASLSERERAVFVLRELEGLETSEVARALGITGITVRRHLALARLRLRRAIGTPDEKKTPSR